MCLFYKDCHGKKEIVMSEIKSKKSRRIKEDERRRFKKVK